MNHNIKITIFVLLLIGIGATWTVAYSIVKTNANNDYTCYFTSKDCSECEWADWNPVAHSRECISSEMIETITGTYRCSRSEYQSGLDGSYQVGDEIVSSTVCEVKIQTDTALPTCETKAENGNFYLRCLANGPADCIDFVDWEEVPYAQPGESKIVGIGTEAGNYEGCVIPEQAE